MGGGKQELADGWRAIHYFLNLSGICGTQATLVANPANMSDFKKYFRQKQTMLLSEDSTIVNKEREAYFNPAGATQSAEIKI